MGGMDKGDPSTIFTKLPVAQPERPEDLNSLSRYPSYSGLSPTQRFVYLNWLQDISRPIDIGYVFIYYYGLEKHLIYGKYAEAFEETNLLRKHHSNFSFQYHSAAALLYSSFLRKEFDAVDRITGLTSNLLLEDLQLVIAHARGQDLGVEAVIALAKKVGANRRYIEAEPALFESNLEETLRNIYGDSFLPLGSKYDASSFGKKGGVGLANYSLEPSVRMPSIPDVLGNVVFQSSVKAVLHEAHLRTKEKVLAARKLAKTQTKKK